MKKNDSHLSQCLFIGIILLVIQQTGQAQVPEPAAWNTFINSAQNVSIRDTFRMQTFEETSQDNWKHTVPEGCILFDASAVGIKGQGGMQSLKLPLGSQINFEHYSRSNYSNVMINIIFGGKSLMPKENLSIKAYRNQENAPIPICTINNSSPYYNITKSQVQNNPPGLDIIVSPKVSDQSTGFYCIDSVYAFGNIPQHSLFSGSGFWNDTVQWSHLPAARHRNALISGQVSIDTNIQCNDLHIGDGALSISQNSHFIANNIFLYYTELLLNKTDISLNKTELLLKSAGELTVNGKVTIKRTFTSKSKWYFISFPFDVYPDGIDTEFELKDETFKGGGNVFYIKTYNGQKRASGSNNQGNWETLSASAASIAEPLFIKNKGYLIALDADATSQTLSFSSQKADIPTDFGKSGTIPVQAFLSQNEAQNEHSGWHLCGNPLPGTLSLSQIEPNPDLDGNIYLYDGSSYTSYPIGSNYTLPPLTAFFVKANTDTEIKINTLIPSANENLLSEASLPLRQFNAEPSTGIQTNQLPLQVINSRIIGDKLYLSSLSSPSHIRIINFSGQVLYSRSVAAGFFTLSLSSLKAGLYILDIEMGNQHIKHKFIRKQ